MELGWGWTGTGLVNPQPYSQLQTAISDNTASNHVEFGYFLKDLLLEIFQVSDMGTPRVK